MRVCLAFSCCFSTGRLKNYKKENRPTYRVVCDRHNFLIESSCCALFARSRQHPQLCRTAPNKSHISNRSRKDRGCPRVSYIRDELFHETRRVHPRWRHSRSLRGKRPAGELGRLGRTVTTPRPYHELTVCSGFGHGQLIWIRVPGRAARSCEAVRAAPGSSRIYLREKCFLRRFPDTVDGIW